MVPEEAPSEDRFADLGPRRPERDADAEAGDGRSAAERFAELDEREPEPQPRPRPGPPRPAGRYTWVVGMNRLRHAYLELHPELEPYFITSQYDDIAGNLKTLGLAPSSAPLLGTVFHGFITLPGMLGVIVAAVGAAIAGLAASGFGASSDAVLLAGVVGFAAVLAVVVYTGRRSYRRYGPSIEARFPTPNG